MRVGCRLDQGSIHKAVISEAETFPIKTRLWTCKGPWFETLKHRKKKTAAATKIKQQNKAETQQPEVNTEQRWLYLGPSIPSAPHNNFEISLQFLQNIIPARMSQNWHR